MTTATRARGAVHAARGLQGQPESEDSAASGRRLVRPRGRALAEQILAVVIEIERLRVGYHRGAASRRLVPVLYRLCRADTTLLGDFLGVSRQAAWELLQRARRDARIAAGTDRRR